MSTVKSIPCAAAAPCTLLDLLQRQAAEKPDRCAYTFRWKDGSEQRLTFGELDCRARAVAATIRRTVQPGDRVLLVYPVGLDFVDAFFGCVYAGVLAVPATYPKPRRPMPRLRAIARDC